MPCPDVDDADAAVGMSDGGRLPAGADPERFPEWGDPRLLPRTKAPDDRSDSERRADDLASAFDERDKRRFTAGIWKSADRERLDTSTGPSVIDSDVFFPWGAFERMGDRQVDRYVAPVRREGNRIGALPRVREGHALQHRVTVDVDQIQAGGSTGYNRERSAVRADHEPPDHPYTPDLHRRTDLLTGNRIEEDHFAGDVTCVRGDRKRASVRRQGHAAQLAGTLHHT